MVNRKRYFVAVQLSSEAKAEVVRLQGGLKKFSGDVYRMASADQLHLTLYYCGECEDLVIERIGDRLAENQVEAVGVELAGLKVLPEPEVAKILSVGVKSRGRRLEKLQQRVHDVCFALSAHQEVRPFAAHVTFARLSKDVPARAKVVKRSVAGIGEILGVRWDVDSVDIMSSEDGKYEVVRTVSLV